MEIIARELRESFDESYRAAVKLPDAWNYYIALKNGRYVAISEEGIDGGSVKYFDNEKDAADFCAVCSDMYSHFKWTANAKSMLNGWDFNYHKKRLKELANSLAESIRFNGLKCVNGLHEGEGELIEKYAPIFYENDISFALACIDLFPDDDDFKTTFYTKDNFIVACFVLLLANTYLVYRE